MESFRESNDYSAGLSPEEDCLHQEAKKAKNLNAQACIEETCAGDGNLLNYAWILKRKRGSADNTISLRVNTLRLIQKKGVDLNKPETFENALATENLTAARKYAWVSCYTSYTKSNEDSLGTDTGQV